MFSCNSNQGFGDFFQSCKQMPARLKKIGDYMYHYDCEIGTGTYSKVYSGVSIQNKKPVAIKVVDLQMIKERNLNNLLFQQTQLLSQLNHPNVIKCHALLKSENRCYIIMELCKDYNLEVLMERTKNKKLPLSEVERIIYDIFEGLQYLAQKSIIHRDLKSANILFSQSGKAKIADFGFATHGLNQFQDNVFVGTPLYMSPQAILEQKYGPKTDIWSFGVIIHEMVFGYAPLSTCKNQDELLSKIVKPVSISANQNVSVALAQLIEGCLQPNSFQRWSLEKLAKSTYIQGIKKKYYIQSNIYGPIRLRQAEVESTATSSTVSQTILSKYLDSMNNLKINDYSSNSSKVQNIKHLHTDTQINRKLISLGNSPNNLKSYQSLQNSDTNKLNNGVQHPIKTAFIKKEATNFRIEQSRNARRTQTEISAVRSHPQVVIQRNSFDGHLQYHQSRLQYSHKTQTHSSNGNIYFVQNRINRQYSQNDEAEKSSKLTIKTVEQVGSQMSLKKAHSNQESRNHVSREQRKSQLMPTVNPFLSTSSFSFVRGKSMNYRQTVSLVHYCRLLHKVLQYPRYYNNYLKKWLMFLIKDLKQNAQLHTMKQSHSQSLRSVLNGYYNQYSKDYSSEQDNKEFIPQVKSVVKILKSLLQIDEQNKDKSCQKQLLFNLHLDTQKLNECLSTENSLQNYSKQSKCEVYLDWFNNKDQKSEQHKTNKIKDK